MKWEKLGFIWKAKYIIDWGSMGTLTPTPVLMNNGVIRVYCGIRDSKGVGRIGFFDVLEDDPKRVIGFSKSPVLDIGLPGSFDDNGMLLGDFLWVDDRLRMYYVGFQLAHKVKFLAYGGLAVSDDGGESFQREILTPIIDRDNEGLYIRAIHNVKKLKSQDAYLAYISEGAGWEVINDIPYPKYGVASILSKDGLNFDRNSSTKINLNMPGEYRLGRSRVFSFESDDHILTFTYGTSDGRYESSYAHSTDLINWERRMDWGLYPGGNGFDSRHLAYPALIRVNNGDIFCFYNGNDMGAEGVGVARLLER